VLVVVPWLVWLVSSDPVCAYRSGRPPPPRIHYPVRTLSNGLQYFARVTAVNRAGLNVSASGMPIKVDTTA
jgi:hypothetical protein